jgi:hypothetical protein
MSISRSTIVISIFLLLICVALSPAQSEEKHISVVVVGYVEKIEIKTDKPRILPWLVSFRVQSVLEGPEENIRENEIIRLHTHGIVRTFGGLEDEILNQKYKLHIFEPISGKDYSGKFVADRI